MMYGKPRSLLWGFDRGLPVHRHYIDLFLTEFAADIRGDCLEFQDRTYLDKFSGPQVRARDVIHLDESNPHATLIADITKPAAMPRHRYDCIICTHVLHSIFDLHAALDGLYRSLRPGGVLLAAVPHISMCDEGFEEYWRFTPLGLRTLMAKAFGDDHVTVRAYGNSIVAAGELRGMVSDEFTDAELHTHDARFATEICGRAVKAAASNGD